MSRARTSRPRTSRGRFSTAPDGEAGYRSARANRSEDRHDRILQAALAVICEEGFDRARIAQIAEIAGVAGGTVIYHFATLDRLLVEALRHADQRFYDSAEQTVAAGRTPLDRLERMVRWVFRADHDNAQLWTLWLETWAQAARHPEIARARAEQDARWRAMIADIVSDLAGAETDTFVLTFASLMDGLAIQVALADAAVDAEGACDIAMRFARQSLRPAPAAGDPVTRPPTRRVRR